MSRPRERDEVLTEIFKFRLSKRQNEILSYLADLNHLTKGRFLRKIIDQATEAGSTTRVVNQLTKPVLAHEKMLMKLRSISLWMYSVARHFEQYNPELGEELRQVGNAAKEAVNDFKEYTHSELY